MIAAVQQPQLEQGAPDDPRNAFQAGAAALVQRGAGDDLTCGIEQLDTAVGHALGTCAHGEDRPGGGDGRRLQVHPAARCGRQPQLHLGG